MIDYLVKQVANGRDPVQVLESAFTFGWNQFVNKYDKDGPDAHGPETNAPITDEIKHFPHVTTGKVPKAHRPGFCYQNSLHNHRTKGMPMVVGFAIPKGEGEGSTGFLAKHGKLSWNPMYRGYDHAWNLDKEGKVVDSTYSAHSVGAEGYEYHGRVVPPQTVASFRNDHDVEQYVAHVSGGGRHPYSPSYKKHVMQGKQFATTEFPPPAAVHNRMTAGGWEHHSGNFRGDTSHHIYVHPKWGSANISIGKSGDVSMISREYTSNAGKMYQPFGTSNYGRKDRNHGGSFDDFFRKYVDKK